MVMHGLLPDEAFDKQYIMKSNSVMSNKDGSSLPPAHCTHEEVS